MSCDSLSNVTKRGEPKSWRTKVHPALLEVLQLYRDFNKTLLKSSPADFKLNAEKLRAHISLWRGRNYLSVTPNSNRDHFQNTSPPHPHAFYLNETLYPDPWNGCAGGGLDNLWKPCWQK